MRGEEAGRQCEREEEERQEVCFSEPSLGFIAVRRPVHSGYPEARRRILLLFTFSLSLLFNSPSIFRSQAMMPSNLDKP
jgi:hypothetical protein